MSEPVMVCIHVQGGVVVDVMSGGVPLDVVVVDYDNIGMGDPGPEDLMFENGVTAEEFMSMPATRGWY